MFLTTIPSIFEGVYHQPVGIAGLHYIALGVGLSGASQINARTLDKVYVYLSNKNGGIGKPEFRLRSCCSPTVFSLGMLMHIVTAAMFVGTVCLPIGLFIAGWTVEAHTHWIAPDIVSVHFITKAVIQLKFDIGYRACWSGYHPQLPVYSDVYRRCVYSSRCVR